MIDWNWYIFSLNQGQIDRKKMCYLKQPSLLQTQVNLARVTLNVSTDSLKKVSIGVAQIPLPTIEFFTLPWLDKRKAFHYPIFACGTSLVFGYHS